MAKNFFYSDMDLPFKKNIYLDFILGCFYFLHIFAQFGKSLAKEKDKEGCSTTHCSFFKGRLFRFPVYYVRICRTGTEIRAKRGGKYMGK